MDHVKYFQDLLKLLEIEKQADQEQHNIMMITKSLRVRVEKGVSWYPVKISFSRHALGGRHLIGIEKINKIDNPHYFMMGKSVSIFNNSLGNKSYVHIPKIMGEITAVGDFHMHISIDAEEYQELPDWLEYGSLGVNQEFAMPTYKRMSKKLGELMLAKQGRTRILRDVILGNKDAVFKKRFDRKEHEVFENLNSSQVRAIEKVVNAQDIAVIHGPPGTGKTTTLVEAIKHLLEQESEKKILVTAPSNAAVDLLTAKIADKGIRVLRIGNPIRMNEKVLSYSLDSQVSQSADFYFLEQLRKKLDTYKGLVRKHRQHYRKKNIAKLSAEQKAMFKGLKGKLEQEIKQVKREIKKTEKFIIRNLMDGIQVITATLLGANSEWIKSGDISTVFIDEAGQALEPAAWIPISKGKRVVLVGDHHQLPPVIKSKEAEASGLGKTLFEKVIENKSAVVMLNTQYRMHEDIMKFSNWEFYGKELSAHESVQYHSLDFMELGPSIMMRAVEFIDTSNSEYPEARLDGSRSLYNQGEAEFLFKHLTYLMSCAKSGLMGSSFSVGIISPYKAQVLFLRDLFENYSYLQQYKASIEINSIDSFQGQERDIVYISLVRSNQKNDIGFLKEKRRMNVALTRARKKLVIIGDKSTLSENRFYSKFFQYIDRIEAYKTADEWNDYFKQISS